jgi:HEAT repeat protein
MERVVTIDELLWRIVARTAYPTAREVIDDVIATATVDELPRLVVFLRATLDDRDSYGRDVVAQVITGLAGIEALPVLVRASARNLGDDQDILQGLIIDLVQLYPPTAAEILTELTEDSQVAVREVAVWAIGFLAE